MNMSEARRTHTVPKTPENSGSFFSGEIKSENEKGVEDKEEESKPTLEGKVDRTITSFSAYINRMAKERGGALPVAEAVSIYSNDLLPGLRAKSFSEGEEKEVVVKMEGTGFYDTGKSVVLPTTEGEATFNLVAVMKDGKPKFTLEPRAGSDMAKRISGN